MVIDKAAFAATAPAAQVTPHQPVHHPDQTGQGKGGQGKDGHAHAQHQFGIPFGVNHDGYMPGMDVLGGEHLQHAGF
ncbi:MAG: hypothetical protein ORN29_02310, partial [Rhodoferax sp.]|nr:hypothetical protein [Rhodoferax sp.]